MQSNAAATRTEQAHQGLGSLEELSGRDGVVIGGVNRDVRKGLLDGVEPGTSRGNCGHDCRCTSGIKSAETKSKKQRNQGRYQQFVPHRCLPRKPMAGQDTDKLNKVSKQIKHGDHSQHTTSWGMLH